MQLILYILAAVLLGLAGLGIGAGRINLGWFGLLCWLIATAFL